MHIIELKDINKSYGTEKNKLKVLDNVFLDIEEGDMVAIMGPSGSGKSTLLNILGCLDALDSGNYYLQGEDISKKSNNQLAEIRNEVMGFVFQNFSLLQDYTVLENVVMPNMYKNSKGSYKEMKKNAKLLIDRIGLTDKINSFPSELSGGQQQRIAIARALMNDPKIILADEPTGALDQATGREIMDVFKEINGRGKTVIIVTHDKNIAAQCNRTVQVLDGKIVS